MRDWADSRARERGGPNAKVEPEGGEDKDAGGEVEQFDAAALSPTASKALAKLAELAPLIDRLRREYPSAFEVKKPAPGRPEPGKFAAPAPAPPKGPPA
mgnify:CR=1 FL=1